MRTGIGGVSHIACATGGVMRLAAAPDQHHQQGSAPARCIVWRPLCAPCSDSDSSHSGASSPRPVCNKRSFNCNEEEEEENIDDDARQTRKPRGTAFVPGSMFSTSSTSSTVNAMTNPATPATPTMTPTMTPTSTQHQTNADVRFIAESTLRAMLSRSPQCPRKGPASPRNGRIHGAYGYVCFGIDDDGSEVAVKVHHSGQTADDREMFMESTMVEADAYAVLQKEKQCPEILRLRYLAMCKGHRIALVFDAWPFDLATFMNRASSPTSSPASAFSAEKLSIMLDVARGLDYMHSLKPHPMLHGDLKYNNVLVRYCAELGRWRACIMDLGLSMRINTLQGLARSNHPGDESFPYLPATDTDLTAAFDMFSFGVLFGCMLLGTFRYYASEKPVAAQLRNAINRKAPAALSSVLPAASAHKLIAFVLSCLDDACTNRPSAADACNVLEAAQLTCCKV